MNSKPFIHLFNTPENNYVYDVNTNAILSVSDSIYLHLSNYLKNENNMESLSDKDKNQLQEFKKQGFLSSNKASKIIHPATNYLEPFLNQQVRMVILQLTQECNLHCSYCVFSGAYDNRKHSRKSMSFDIAKKAIDFLIDHSSELNEITVGFYGGEPLLKFDLFKQCVSYALNQVEGKKVNFSFTTNATLLNKDIIDFLVKYDIGIMISLDGPKEIHNKNRKYAKDEYGSFDKVIENVEMINRLYPDYLKKKVRFNIVLDPEKNFSCVSDFFTSYETIKDAGISVSDLAENYVKKEFKNNNDFYINRDYEIFKYYLATINKLDRKHTSRLVVEYYNDMMKNMNSFRKPFILKNKIQTAHHSGPCIPGRDRLFVDADGNFRPCERVSENSEVMKIGNIEDGFDIEQIKKILNVGLITEEDCKDCWSFRFCTLCAAFADDLNDLSSEIKKSHCKSVHYSVETQLKQYCVLEELKNNKQGKDYE